MDDIIQAWLYEIEEIGIWAELEVLEEVLERMPPMALNEPINQAHYDGYTVLRRLIDCRRREDSSLAVLRMIETDA